MANKVLTKLNSGTNTYVAHNNISYSGTGKTLYSDTNGTIDLAGVNGIFPAIDSESVGKLLSSTGTQLVWKNLEVPSEGIAGVVGESGITVTSTGGIATVGHANTVTAVANKQAYKITLDGQGHVNSAPTLYNPD